MDGQHAADFAPSSHGHYQSDIAGLPESLAGKADASHNHDGVYQKKYAGVAVVAKSGGDYADPSVAMNDYATWCGTPSASNPCLLKIMPGVYDVGGNAVVMQSYIDIEGSGQTTTEIRGSVDGLGNGDPGVYRGLVKASSSSEIRALTISDSAYTSSCGIYSWYTDLKISDVTIIVSNGNGRNIGIFAYASAVVMDRVTITASGPGIWGVAA